MLFGNQPQQTQPPTTIFITIYYINCGLGKRSRYSNSLQAGRSGDRMPAGGLDFPHPSGPALGLTLPPTQWVPGLCWGQCGRGVALTTHPSNAEFKEGVESYTSTQPLSPRGLF